MEYLLGSVMTLILVVVVNRVLRRQLDNAGFAEIKYSQSYIHYIVSPFLPSNRELAEDVVTQSTKHFEKQFLRVVYAENKAYWIKDNVFYVSELDEEGSVEQSKAKQVDTMSMSKVELDKMMLIIEKLTEGNSNDTRNAGQS